MTYFAASFSSNDLDRAIESAKIQGIRCIDCTNDDGTAGGSLVLVQGQWRHYEPQPEDGDDID